MKRRTVVLRMLVAAALALVALMAMRPPLCAKTAPPSPRTPVLVSLRDLARSYGLEESWLEPTKKLRLKNRTIELVFEVDRREILFNGVRVVMGDAAVPARRSLAITAIDRDRLIAPILSPEKIEARSPVRLILVDPGHGGHDTGTRNAALKLEEKDLALDVARRLKPQLEARGFTVVLTRSDDTFVTLNERAAKAAAIGADLFLAVHFNAADDANVRGIETYVVTPQYQRSTGSPDKKADDDVVVPGNRFDGWNAFLGYTVHRRLTGALGMFDRGLKHARFVVLRDLGACPGLLIEGGYLSNTAEARAVGEAAYRERLAAAIAEGVDAYNQTLEQLAVRRGPKPAAPPASATVGALRARPTKPGAEVAR